MCQYGIFYFLCTENKKQKNMEVVSAREFRASQRKFLTMANNGEDLILKARGLGSFRIIPVTAKDRVTNKADLTERICQALREVKLMQEGKLKELSMDELFSVQKGLEDIKNGRTTKIKDINNIWESIL